MDSTRCDRCGGKGQWRYVKDDHCLTVCAKCDRVHAVALDRQGWRVDTLEGATA